MKKKLLIALPILLLAGGYFGYSQFMAPKAKPVKLKIKGSLVGVGDPFTVNLAHGRFARLSVALLVTKAPAADPAAPAGTPVLPQNDAVRAIVTDDLTGVDSSALIAAVQRHDLEAKILADLKKSTDVPVTKLLFTDLAVQ